MWTLRRASIHLNSRGICTGTTRVQSVKTEIAICYLENSSNGYVQLEGKPSSKFNRTYSSFPKSCREVRSFSSQAGASSGEEDDELEDGFSELDTTDEALKEASSVDENDDGLTSESELSELEEDVAETYLQDKNPPNAEASFPVLRAILAADSLLSISKDLDKLVAEGHEVTETEMILTSTVLRKRRLFYKALQFSEWLESKMHLELTERHYASHLDLIAKVSGIFRAEAYVQRIPESFRGERVYRTLLANSASVGNVKKTEEVFNKMKDLGFPMSVFTFNQLLVLYKKTDKKKIADVLLQMEKQDVKPSLFTYNILIDVKGQSNDISGMDLIVETMKAEGLAITITIKACLARHYAKAGRKAKAESLIKEIEGDDADLLKTRKLASILLPLYASIGRDDEVERIWEVCVVNPTVRNCYAAIEAWGRLKRVEKAEEAFVKLLTRVKIPSTKHFIALLKVYADNKMLAKGEDLVSRMGATNFRATPIYWDALVKLYVGGGEVEKADSVLEKATIGNKARPLFSTYSALMQHYSKKGDVHNAEKIFLKMRQSGYVSRISLYELLLETYINANAPAYGFSDRMKADNLYPNRHFARLLAQADAFKKKTPVPESVD